jgi:hypothetical protein
MADVLTVKQAAKKKRVTIQAVRLAIKDGRIFARRANPDANGLWLVRNDDRFEAWKPNRQNQKNAQRS